MCGTILWVGEQNDSTTLQSIYSMHRWPPLQRRRNKICWIIVKYMLSKFSEMLKLGTYWKTWYSLVSEQTCTIDYEMDQRLWQSVISYGLLHSSYMWIYSIVTRETLPNECFKTPILQEILRIQNLHQVEHCIFFGSRTFGPRSWMCKKQTSVSHSSKESEKIRRGSCWWFMGSDLCSSWKHESEPYRTVRPVVEQTWSLFSTSHDSQTQAISESDQWFG